MKDRRLSTFNREKSHAKSVIPRFVSDFLSDPVNICRESARIARINRTASKILEEYRAGQIFAKVKPVYFFGDYGAISFKLGGSYMIAALRKAGIAASPGYCVPVESIRDSILVFIKSSLSAEPRAIKARGNKIVIDFHDDINSPTESASKLMDCADYMIFPNRGLRNKILGIRKSLPASVILYGFADPAITLFFKKEEYRKYDELRCCYFGHKQNLDCEMLAVLKDIIDVDIIPVSSNDSFWLKKLALFNAHVDLRKGLDENMYKPLTKILIAAECNSNVILEKTPRVLELLPADYPFFVSRTDKEHNMKILGAKVNGPEWQYALSIMDDIRKKYTFNKHVASILKILRELS